MEDRASSTPSAKEQEIPPFRELAFWLPEDPAQLVTHLRHFVGNSTGNFDPEDPRVQEAFADFASWVQHEEEEGRLAVKDYLGILCTAHISAALRNENS